MKGRGFASPELAPFMVLGVICLVLAGRGDTPQANMPALEISADLPIADLHLHPDPALSASEIQAALDANGLLWGGLGARRGTRSTWLAVLTELGFRFAAFAGQTELNLAYFAGRASCPDAPDRCGVAAMEDGTNATIQALLRTAEIDFQSGQIKGVGEIFINNLTSAPLQTPGHARKVRANAPSIRRLYELASRYEGFLTFHMEPDPDSIAQLEDLLSSDRRGRIVWNHCGTRTTAGQVRPLLVLHPNLFCDLSFRYPPQSNSLVRKIFDAAGIDPSWRELIEEFPDRFMIGTDVLDGQLPGKGRSAFDESLRVVRTGLLPHLTAGTARKVACENAQRLFKLIVPFATVTARVATRADEFDVSASVTLGTCSSGIDPSRERVQLQVGSFSTIIPPGSFVEDEPRVFSFRGIIDDTTLEVMIGSSGDNRFEFSARAGGRGVTVVSSPVRVTLTIGDDTGGADASAD